MINPHVSRWLVALAPCFFQSGLVHAQHDSLQTAAYGDDITVTMDWMAPPTQQIRTRLILYALPNGNTTAQTMGKKMEPGDDWHFDIQHIRAQTAFLRQTLPNERILVAYLENRYLSWPRWKSLHGDHAQVIASLVDSLINVAGGSNTMVCLNGHSGGGRFIFSYLDGKLEIPAYVKRIAFLDSDYGYDSSYRQKLLSWLKGGADRYLTVFAYNDSVALYNGKPVVSATGGTWYRSRLMQQQLSSDISLQMIRNDSIVVYASPDRRIQFLYRLNPERKIYHTQQVELNGFIHSQLAGTPWEEKEYRYYGERAYQAFIR